MKKNAETRFNKVFLLVKRLENDLYKDVFKLKHFKDTYDNFRKSRTNGRSAPCPTPHCIKMFNILFQNLKIGMKIHK